MQSNILVLVVSTNDRAKYFSQIDRVINKKKTLSHLSAQHRQRGIIKQHILSNLFTAQFCHIMLIRSQFALLPHSTHTKLWGALRQRTGAHRLAFNTNRTKNA